MISKWMQGRLKLLVVSGCVGIMMAFTYTPLPESILSSPSLPDVYRKALLRYHRRYVWYMQKGPEQKEDFLFTHSGAHFAVLAALMACDYGEIPATVEELENSPALLWIPIVERVKGKPEKWMRPGPLIDSSEGLLKQADNILRNYDHGTVAFGASKTLRSETRSYGDTVQFREGIMVVVTKTPWRESQGAEPGWMHFLHCPVEIQTPFSERAWMWILKEYLLNQVAFASALYFAKTGEVAKNLADLDEAVGKRNEAAKAVFEDPVFLKIAEEFFKRLHEEPPVLP